MKKILQPIGNLVLVKLTESAAETQSGIILPDISIPPPEEGVVCATGWTDERAGDHAVRLHDLVMLPKYGGIEITLDGGKHRLIEELDILGIVRWVTDAKVF
jgi:chaperonin GroES